MKKKLVILLVFSIAMGFLEGAVVVYLRELLYPNGFSFPLAPVPDKIAFTELIREAATIIMLASIAFLCGTTRNSRWAFFLIAFAIWDLTYYFALKLILDWPDSIFTWDILFLIPVPWIGPVIAPCLIAVLMIILAMGMLQNEKYKKSVVFSRSTLVSMGLGCSLILISFMQDYITILNERGLAAAIWTPGSAVKLFEVVNVFVPHAFNWELFFSGICLFVLGIIKHLRKLFTVD
ncbi:hypothetical protein BH11BAC2_BH11BAC2_07430 [soil metagenome]